MRKGGRGCNNGGLTRGGVLICCLHYLINHNPRPLSRRSTVRTPNSDASNIRALIAILPYLTTYSLLTQPPSCLPVGHHLSLRITIVFSLLSINSLPKPRCQILLVSSFLTLAHPGPPCTFHILLPYMILTAYVHPRPPPPDC